MEQEQMLEALWSYIDGTVSTEEKRAIEKLIDENAEWKSEYASLLSLHQSLDLVELEEPSLRFTKNVMEQISREKIAPAAKSYLDSRLITGLAFFFIAIIVGFIIYGFSQVNWHAASPGSTIFGVDLNSIDFSPMYSNNFINIFLMINVVVGLFLLDRVLESRKKPHGYTVNF